MFVALSLLYRNALHYVWLTEVGCILPQEAQSHPIKCIVKVWYITTDIIENILINYCLFLPINLFFL